MKTIKLSNAELNSCTRNEIYVRLSSVHPIGYSYKGLTLSDKSATIVSYNGGINSYWVLNVTNEEQLREFINDEIVRLKNIPRKKYSNQRNIRNLKSILSKLDKAVQKVTLELTKSEYKAIDNVPDSIHIWNVLIMDSIVAENQFKVLDVDKFRKFLNDEMLHYFTMAEKESIRNTSLAIDNIRIHNNLKSILNKLDLAVVQYDKPKDVTLKKLRDIVNWVEGKYDGDELREHMIVKTIKKELLS